MNGGVTNRITKAIFPVAGFGSRFLPATKASPKEMMPVVDKPLIQYAVEEAVAAGFSDMVFITGRNKRTIEDHFDTAYEIEAELCARGKDELLHAVQAVIPAHVNFIYIRQHEALGLGHAVRDEPFAVILADDLIDGNPPVMAQMVRAYQQHGCAMLAVQQVERSEVSRYGIVSSTALSPTIEQVTGIVEKPSADVAPSTLAVVGRYIFTPRIFRHLAQVSADSDGEIQLTDAIVSLLAEEKFLACRFKGIRYDCGSKLGYLKAQVAYGLKHADLRDDFARYLRTLK
jgi:UTP--glucose-1-phosphate uridylyltransferase